MEKGNSLEDGSPLWEQSLSGMTQTGLRMKLFRGEYTSQEIIIKYKIDWKWQKWLEKAGNN